MSILHDKCCRTWAQRVALAVMGLIVTGSVWAEEPLRIEAVRLESARPEPTRGWTPLDGDKLVPKVSIAMESISAFYNTARPGQPIHDHVMHEELTNSVRRGAERMVRRAARDYLLQAVRLDRPLLRVRTSVGAVGASTTRSDDLKFRLGVRSMLPVVGMRYRNGAGALDLSVGATGAVGVRFRPQRFQGTQISAGFDGDDTFQVRARMGF